MGIVIRKLSETNKQSQAVKKPTRPAEATTIPKSKTRVAAVSIPSDSPCRRVFIEGEAHGKRFDMEFGIERKHTKGFSFVIPGCDTINITANNDKLVGEEGMDVGCTLTWGDYTAEADYYENNGDGFVVVHE
jgi:hypothetical protein